MNVILVGPARFKCLDSAIRSMWIALSSLQPGGSIFSVVPSRDTGNDLDL